MAVLVGIAGGTGSGKTSLATKIRDRVGEDRCLRLSVAAADDVLSDGLSRLAGFLESLPAQVA